jgi:hypothetical protein
MHNDHVFSIKYVVEGEFEICSDTKKFKECVSDSELKSYVKEELKYVHNDCITICGISYVGVE